MNKLQTAWNRLTSKPKPPELKRPQGVASIPVITRSAEDTMKIDVVRDFLLTIDSGSLDRVFLKVFEEAAKDGWKTTDGPNELLAKIKTQYHG